MKHLTKSSKKQISGVCGGIAEFLDIDPTIVRAGVVIGAFVTGIFPVVPIYFIASWLMPEENHVIA